MMTVETVSKKRELLESLPEAKSLTHLAALTGISRNTIYRYLNEDDEFKTNWDRILTYMVESAVDQAKLASDEVVTTWLQGLKDLEHPQYAVLLKEYNRMLEKRSGKQTGEIRLELDF